MITAELSTLLHRHFQFYMNIHRLRLLLMYTLLMYMCHTNCTGGRPMRHPRQRPAFISLVITVTLQKAVHGLEVAVSFPQSVQSLQRRNYRSQRASEPGQVLCVGFALRVHH
jgi:hypothetical protein